MNISTDGRLKVSKLIKVEDICFMPDTQGHNNWLNFAGFSTYHSLGSPLASIAWT